MPVILDGENCWEYYIHNGRPFLEALYRLINESNELEATSIHEALRDAPPRSERTIGRIYAGSWIGSNFKIWIGHDEDNRAWDALAQARETLMSARGSIDAATFARAMEEIYIAEGSDWFWWFGDENSSANQDDFDDLFRAHLREVYTLIGQPPPETLDTPIRRAGRRAAVHPPSGHITPTIDGLRASNEWADAGHFIVEQIGGAMHHADAFERRVWFGSDDANFYIRFDTPLPLAADTEIRLTLHGKRAVTLSFTPSSVAMAVAGRQRSRSSIRTTRVTPISANVSRRSSRNS